jgi:ketosteroid isomerase-like protein
VSAEDQIRQTMARYIHAHDSHEVDAIVACFAPDGVFASATSAREGQSAIREFFEASRARSTSANRQMKLMCGNSVIDVDGDTAAALTDVVGFERIGGEPWRVFLVGRYADKFVQRGNEWLYREKRVLV